MEQRKQKKIIKMGNHEHIIYDDDNFDTYYQGRLICITRDDKQYWVKSK